MPLVWLSVAFLACAPALTLRRDDLLLFPTAFVALFYASAVWELSRRSRPPSPRSDRRAPDRHRGRRVREPRLRAELPSLQRAGRVVERQVHLRQLRLAGHHPAGRREAIARQLASVGIRNEAQLKTRLRKMVAEAIAEGRRTRAPTRRCSSAAAGRGLLAFVM